MKDKIVDRGLIIIFIILLLMLIFIFGHCAKNIKGYQLDTINTLKHKLEVCERKSELKDIKLEKCRVRVSE